MPLPAIPVQSSIEIQNNEQGITYNYSHKYEEIDELSTAAINHYQQLRNPRLFVVKRNSMYS